MGGGEVAKYDFKQPTVYDSFRRGIKKNKKVSNTSNMQ